MLNINKETQIEIERSLNSDLLSIKLQNGFEKDTDCIEVVEKMYINIKEEDMKYFISELQKAFENL